MLNRSWNNDCCELLALENKQDNGVFNLAVPRSACPNCQHQITAIENIPVLSYLWLKGKCSACKQAISARYPIVEVITAILSVLVILTFTPSAQGYLALLLLWFLIAITLIDYDTQLLPDQLSLPLLWLGLIINSQGLFTDLTNALWGAVAGYLSLWSVYWAFKLTTGKDGMGYGDFKLLAALGAWMGWQMLPLIVLLSAVVGAVVGGCLIAFSNQDSQKPIAFGPFLAGAGFIALLWGEQIWQSYLQFSGLA